MTEEELKDCLNAVWVIVDLYATKKDFRHLGNFIRSFIGRDYDLNILKTILVVTKSFKDNTYITIPRGKILREFNERQIKLRYDEE